MVLYYNILYIFLETCAIQIALVMKRCLRLVSHSLSHLPWRRGACPWSLGGRDSCHHPPFGCAVQPLQSIYFTLHDYNAADFGDKTRNLDLTFQKWHFHQTFIKLTFWTRSIWKITIWDGIFKKCLLQRPKKSQSTIQIRNTSSQNIMDNHIERIEEKSYAATFISAVGSWFAFLRTILKNEDTDHHRAKNYWSDWIRIWNLVSNNMKMRHIKLPA